MAFSSYVQPLTKYLYAVAALSLLSGCFMKADLSQFGIEASPSEFKPASGPLKIVRPSPLGSKPTSYANESNTLYFLADVPGIANASYVTDGIPSGTKDIRSVSTFLPVDSKYYGALGSVRIFYSPSLGELWRSDGTAPGTYKLLTTADPMQMYGSPSMKLDASGTIGWWYNSGIQALIQTDGTVAGSASTAIGFFAFRWGVVSNGAVIVRENKTPTPWLMEVYLFDFATKSLSLVNSISNRDAGRGEGYQDGTSRFYFPVHEWGIGNYMAYTDGTPAGTVQLNTDVMMDNVLMPVGKVSADVIFLGQPAGGTKAYKFFTTRGTSASDWTEIKDTGYKFTLNAWYVDFTMELNGRYVVRFYDYNAASTPNLCPVWVTDGTPSGTLQVGGVAIDDPATLTYDGSTQKPFVFNNVLYFQGYDSTNGTELWSYDGVSAPALFADINPGVANGIPIVSDVTSATYAGVTPSFFVVPMMTAANGIEPFVSDGTVAGTKLLKDIRPGSSSSQGGSGGTQFDFQGINGKVVFSANEEATGTEFWTTDGTEAGTKILASLNGVPGPSSMTALQVLNGKIYFSADDGNTGTEPWVSDGTASGTHILTDVNSSTISSHPSRFVSYNGSTYFLAVPDATLNDGKTSLWKTDGTAAGTTKIAHQKFTSASSIETFNAGLFMIGTDTTNGREPWTSDGTSAGTQMVRNIATGTSHSLNTSIDWLFNWNGKLLFAPNRGGTIKNDPWITDGTLAGTNLIANLNTTGGGRPRGGYGTNQWFYFWASDATAGYELFKTDATTGNTALVKDIRSGISNSMVYADSFFGDVAGKVIFLANDGTNGQELWVSDGTSVGTQLLKDVTAGSGGTTVLASAHDANFVYLLLQPQGGNWELWKSDGTTAGTLRFHEFAADEEADLLSGQLALVNGNLFFSMCDTDHGCEVWRSDGTSSGTELFWDANSGVTSTSPRSFVEYQGGLYFIGAYQGGGETLWRMNPSDASLAK